MSTTSESPKYQPPANGFRTFIIVWITQSISVFGTALTFFALVIWLTQVLYPNPEQKAQLAIALSAIGIAYGLPNVFIAPLAGAWADRSDRKRTMMVMDAFSGCLSLALMTLIITHMLQLWMLIIFIVFYSVSGAFHFSAFDTSYAMIVPEEQLPRANGMMQTVGALSGILSPAIAASLISIPALARQGIISGGLGSLVSQMKDGTPLAIGIDAVTFFIASATLLFLFIPSPKRTDLKSSDGKVKKSIWADVKEGAVYIWQRRPMLWLLGTFTAANLVGSFMVLQPMIVKFTLAADWAAKGFTMETALALLASVGGIGGVIGGVIISTWGGLKKRRVYGVVVPMIIASLGQLVFGLSPWLYLSVAAAALMEGMVPAMNAHSQAIWQIQTPRELQGRVFSVRRLIAQFSTPFGTIVAGATGGVFDPGWVVAGSGAFLMLFCIAQLFNPYLLRVEDKAYLDKMAEKANGKIPASA